MSEQDDLWPIIRGIRQSMVPFEQQLNRATRQRHIPAYREIDVARAALNIARRADAIAVLASAAIAQTAGNEGEGS